MDKDAAYFSHDANARIDPKIQQMRCVYGMEGYGIYWALVEKMREQADYKLPISGRYSIVAYADELKVDPEKLQQFIDDSIKEFTGKSGGLFNTDGVYLWSDSLLRRMALKDNKSDKNRENAFKRWNKPAVELEITPPPVKNKSTEKDKKQKFGIGGNVKLTPEEHAKLIDQFGEDGTAERINRLSTYIGSKGDKYRSHYLTILNWENKEKRDKKQGSAQPAVSPTDIEIER